MHRNTLKDTVIYPKKNIDKMSIRFDNGMIEAVVADSLFKRSIGLSFSRPLEENKGMAFIFRHANKPIFWNFGMCFPIDVIWIKNDMIIAVQKNIPKMTRGIKIFYPPFSIDMALEVPAGTADKIGAVAYKSIDITHSLKL